VAALLLALCGPQAVQAQSLPSHELLAELRARLLQPPACAPQCISVASLELRIDPARLLLRAEVHAQATVTYQAPGPLESWAPDSVRVDGKDALAAVRSADGFLHVRLEQGVHEVELSGPVPRTQAFTLALGTPPHHVRAEHKGFVVDGLRDDGRAEGSLSLRREVAASSADEATSQSLVQWFEVRRELELGIRFRVRTSVTRLGPANESALVRLPLLPGESVSEAGLVADRDAVVLELRRGESVKSFASSLAPAPSLKLSAAQPKAGEGPLAQPFSEVWVVAPSVLYRPSFEGIAPIAYVGPNGSYQPEYRPFPGESVTIHAARLSGAEGASITTDSAMASFTPGRRMERASLRLRLRTSRGATEHLILPSDAQLTSVAVDGVARPSRIKDGKLELLLDPGAHEVAVALQRPVGMEFVYRPLHLSTGLPLTNVTTEVRVPDGRWLLWARGPAWGPAVLFWGYLLVVLLFGVPAQDAPVVSARARLDPSRGARGPGRRGLALRSRLSGAPSGEPPHRLQRRPGVTGRIECTGARVSGLRCAPRTRRTTKHAGGGHGQHRPTLEMVRRSDARRLSGRDDLERASLDLQGADAALGAVAGGQHPALAALGFFGAALGRRLPRTSAARAGRDTQEPARRPRRRGSGRGRAQAQAPRAAGRRRRRGTGRCRSTLTSRSTRRASKLTLAASASRA
jgi:hypothetical protein